MSLIELLASMAVASIVAAVALAGSAPLATRVRSGLTSARLAAAPDDILRAMLADVRADNRWFVCTIASGCAIHTGRGHGVALAANGHAWTVYEGGVQACSPSHCEGVLPGVVALQFLVDRAAGDGAHRREAIQRRDVAGAMRLEARLWFVDGSMRSQSTWLGP